jgi:hypothetical protein
MFVPEMLKVYAVALASLMAGAAVVHTIMKPDLTLPVEPSGGDTPAKPETQQ